MYLSTVGETLFRRQEIGEYLERLHAEIKQWIDSVDENKLLGTDEQQFISGLLEEFTVQVPQFDLKSITRDDPKDARLPDNLGRWVNALAHYFYIPFTGNEELFHCRPPRTSFRPPKASSISNSGVLTIQINSSGYDAASVRAELDRELGEINGHLAATKEVVNPFNQNLRKFIEDHFRLRKNHILRKREDASNMDIPLRKINDKTTSVALPMKSRRRAIKLPVQDTSLASPEPRVSDESFREVVEVSLRVVDVLERSPSTFVQLDEESLRDIFLVLLNSNFLMEATAETFSRAGKTDIILKFQDRSAFIAECKFWTGEKSLLKAIDQVLSYSVWRDPRVVIYLFVKNKSFTDVVNAIPSTVAKHMGFLSRLPNFSENTFHFKLSRPDDEKREIELVVSAIHVARPR